MRIQKVDGYHLGHLLDIAIVWLERLQMLLLPMHCSKIYMDSVEKLLLRLFEKIPLKRLIEFQDSYFC
jgi:hypothetical protein